MKSVVFTRHAFKRINQRSNVMKYAERMFRKAELIHTAPSAGTLYFRNGNFRFIVVETPTEYRVLTVIKD